MNKFMKMALEVAEKGRGKTEPNPLVGAVIVKEEKVIATGFHAQYGGKHAEEDAIKKAGRKAKGADLYVTLEPCNHYGKRPPCTKTILKSGVKRVFIAMRDPNKGSLNGAAELKKNGVKVITGIMEKEAKKQNNFYITGLGSELQISMKIALTEKGFITWGNGKRKIVSGKNAFEFTQKLREKSDAIIVGINTVIKDDPKLSVRGNPNKNPVRVVLDSKLRIPKNAKIFSEKGETIIFCTNKAPRKKITEISKKAIVIIAGKKINIYEIVHELYMLGLRKILVEPGQRIATSFLEKKLFDKLYLIVSQKKIKKGVVGFGLKKKVSVKLVSTKKLGKDTLMVLER